MEPHFNPIEEENWKQFEIFVLFTGSLMGFPGGTAVKNPPANAEDTGDLGAISGMERSPRRENGNPFQYSCLRIPWTEKRGRLQSLRSQRAGHD